MEIQLSKEWKGCHHDLKLKIKHIGENIKFIYFYQQIPIKNRAKCKTIHHIRLYKDHE